MRYNYLKGVGRIGWSVERIRDTATSTFEIFEGRVKTGWSKERNGIVCGVGVNDVGFHVEFMDGGIRKQHPAYSCWYRMLRECTSKGYGKGGVLCDEWVRFSRFLKWYKEKNVSGYVFTRVVLEAWGMYSPDNCVFVPPYIASTLNRGKNVGTVTRLPSGNFSANLTVAGKKSYLGAFKTEKEARAAMVKAKMEYLQAIKPEMDAIDSRIFKRACEVATGAM